MQSQGKARRAVAAAVGALVLWGAAAAGAQAESTVAIGVPADVILHTPVTITVSGTAEVAAELHVITHSACEPFAPSEAGDPLPAGPFTQTRTVTFDGWEDKICVWIDEPDAPWNVHARAAATVRARRAVASLSVTTPPLDPGVPTTVTATGTTDAPRVLDVHFDYYCEDGPSDYRRAYEPPVNALSPPEGIVVGPGPFSVSVPWTPAGPRGSQVMACAYLSPPGYRVFPDARAMGGGDWALPKLAVSSPADLAEGELLNPRFAWTASDRPRRDPVAADVVEIVRVDGSKRVPLLRIGTKSYRALSSLSWRYLRIEGKGDTSDIAVVDGSSFKFAYGGGFMPGTYEWRVLRDGWESPPTRTFVVRPKPLSSFRLKVSPERGDSSDSPAFAQVELTSVPFLFIRLHRRLSGSPWRLSEWRSWSAYQRDVLYGTCRRPGGRIHWRLHVRDAFGTERTRSGSFANASRALCAQLKRREAEERRRDSERRRADARRRAEAERRRRDAERRRIQSEIDRYKRNCRAIGGTPVLIEGYWYCRADAGGTLDVPGF